MKTLQQKQLTFLEETANHYNLSNRCFDNARCRYSPVTLNLVGQSEGCALGRHLTPELALELDGLGNVSIYSSDVFNKLPKKLKELGRYFLTDIQDLHDYSDNWDKNGLSKRGKGKVEQIKNNYNLIS